VHGSTALDRKEAEMPCDLGVDTVDIHAAASALRDAADYLEQPSRLPVAAEVRAAVPHGSASAREALRLAIRRAEEALAASQRLADIASDTAGSLDAAADSFDRAEQQCLAGF
jgi:hypothetical protein